MAQMARRDQAGSVPMRVQKALPVAGSEQRLANQRKAAAFLLCH
jgi:hypothetical protein